MPRNIATPKECLHLNSFALRLHVHLYPSRLVLSSTSIDIELLVDV